ncbi:MAG TPA: hypothetical protein PLL06_01620 [Acidobacteriota bacterium]|nr:hypothetical protein [Acidobacteriota bacterium]HMZ78369.1 hypothetical protein [Acidobacteriota bacterium]HNB73448.1 hypothetical protein [Acidobacteriota bacterium]HNC42786.1 hypothetical protein [Acidobacteriota bacterium]HNG91563.1 hypothetical protein [Acidobacteriota bacterium]
METYECCVECGGLTPLSFLGRMRKRCQATALLKAAALRTLSRRE